MGLAERIREAMGDKSPADIARATQKTPAAVTQWLDGSTKSLKAETAALLEMATGYRATWIVTGKGPKKAEQTYAVDSKNYRKVWVIGKGQGGLPERIWSDGDFPVGDSNEYAEVASSDPQAFLVPVNGNSMAPRYHHGEFALVEPSTVPDLEDDVLVRLASGETMLKRLLSRRAGYRFGSYNDTEVLNYTAEQVSWVYYVAHPVPTRKIKNRV